MMYRIEFDGKLLEGFDPALVRLDVGVRLRLRETQIDRLFSGRTVVLKKEVSEANSRAYMTELRSMGLDARLVPLEVVEPVATADAGYKVVYWGRVLPGFERTAVMQAAAKRLRISPAILMQLFSGAKVVLKRGVPAEQGARLVVDLALIGMQIELELEAPALVSTAKPTPAGVPELPSAAQQDDDPQYGALLRTACDLSGTAFSGYDTSSTVARDEPPPLAPVVPARAPSPRDTGIAAATTDGYLNCPQCGFYQPYALTCGKCGTTLPKPRLYVGQADPMYSSAPTVLVTRDDESPAAAQMPPGKSLHSVLREQDEVEHSEAKASRRWLAAVIVLILAGVGGFLLSR